MSETFEHRLLSQMGHTNLRPLIPLRDAPVGARLFIDVAVSESADEIGDVDPPVYGRLTLPLGWASVGFAEFFADFTTVGFDLVSDDEVWRGAFDVTYSEIADHRPVRYLFSEEPPMAF